jgi:hypothetical protein
MSKARKIDVIRAERIRRMEYIRRFLTSHKQPKALREIEKRFKQPFTVEEWLLFLNDHPKDLIVAVHRGRVVLTEPKKARKK